ncbi:hypothetical protein AB0L65_10035 [Nonomuraea sp. NPDC052116]|uniref:hypothetical protein n=1 Tax=Nonomuraea sp. NPDC052116 TaxID=3155665 RepID=UPI0034382537
MLAAPALAVQSVLGLWPLLALVVAAWIDSRAIRAAKAAHPELLLEGERPNGWSGLRAIGRYATGRPPWGVVVICRFVLTRRAALLIGDGPALRLASDLRQRLSARRAAGGRGELRVLHYWPVLVWAVLVLPAVVYFAVGTTPATARAQGTLAASPGFVVMLALLVVGLLWIGWRMVSGLRLLRRALRAGYGEGAALAQFQVFAAAGAGVLGVLNLAAWLRGAAPGQRVMIGAHVLEALDALLLYGGIALLLLAFLWFPPVGAVALAGGGIALVPTVSAGFVGLGALGLTGIALSQASPESSEGGEGGEQEAPDEDFEGTGFSREERAQLVYRHAGGGDLAGRPSFGKILETLTKGRPTELEGQNAVKYEYQGVRVIINRDQPLRSTGYRIGGRR